MNSLLEFTELLKNRLTDLLLIEADNDKHVFLYLADGYWTAFEKSAYRLCRIYEPVMLLPMRLPFVPFPIVTASINQDSLQAALNFTDYQNWHDRATHALRNLKEEALPPMID